MPFLQFLQLRIVHLLFFNYFLLLLCFCQQLFKHLSFNNFLRKSELSLLWKNKVLLYIVKLLVFIKGFCCDFSQIQLWFSWCCGFWFSHLPYQNIFLKPIILLTFSSQRIETKASFVLEWHSDETNLVIITPCQTYFSCMESLWSLPVL